MTRPVREEADEVAQAACNQFAPEGHGAPSGMGTSILEARRRDLDEIESYLGMRTAS